MLILVINLFFGVFEILDLELSLLEKKLFWLFCIIVFIWSLMMIFFVLYDIFQVMVLFQIYICNVGIQVEYILEKVVFDKRF